MTNYTVGHSVERIVARHLEKKGYTLLEQNWKTKWCEIDLVMTKEKVMYFVEVKFRSSGTQGAGSDYITDKKLAQMNRAAESWMALNKYEGNARLMAASVDRQTSTVRYIEI